MQALIGVTFLGFASYCLTLASLPVYAVQGGADESTAGVVTAVLLVCTIAFQATIPALTARFGVGPVLVVGLVAMGVPSPLYVLDDGVAWISALSAVRGAGFAVLTVLGATLSAQVAPPERRGESIGLYGLAIAVPNMIAVPGGVALVLGDSVGWRCPGSRPRRCSASRSCRCSCATVGPQPAAGAAGTNRAAVLAAVAPSLVLFVVTMAGGGRGDVPAHRAAGRRAGHHRPAAVRRDRRGEPLAGRDARRPAGRPAAAAARRRAGGRRAGRRRRRAGGRRRLGARSVPRCSARASAPCRT